MEQPEALILDLILRSLRERRALCGVILATYRVELTQTLNHMAGSGAQPRDLYRVSDLADRIAATAGAAGLASVQEDALALRLCLSKAVERCGKKELGAVFVAGLKVIDRILDAGKLAPKPNATPSLN